MMAGYRGKPSALAFDSSGIVLATGGGKNVTTWSFRGNGPEGTAPGVLEGHSHSVTALAFAPDAMLLASGERDRGVIVWFLREDAAGQPVGVAHTRGAVSALYWSPDGNALAAFDGGGSVTLWPVSLDV